VCNAPAVLALRLAPGQERFVSSVADSLEEADEAPHGNPWSRAVCGHSEGATELLTSHVPGEGGPAGFYAGLGPLPTGELDPDDEVILRLDLRG
jgi:hypothetical protein